MSLPQEDFLHYVWQMQYFDKKNLRSTTQQAINILDKGQHNHHSGPDFSSARLVLNNTEWAGDVEIHVRSSEWRRHQHHHNPAYSKVILHVVWEDDDSLQPAAGQVPVLELKNKLHEGLFERYLQFFDGVPPFPCASYTSHLPQALQERVLLQNWIGRQNRKINDIHSLYLRNHKNLEETAYQLLGQGFGLSINQEPFLRLCQQLPHKYLQKHANQAPQIEALLFGMSGLLPEQPKDDYSQALVQEFAFLSHKYNLKSHKLLLSEWKFSKLRPPSFPTVRLAHFAALMYGRQHFFAELIHAESLQELKAFFGCQPSAYWHTHYDFGKESKLLRGGLGTLFTEVLILNVVVYLGLFYAELKGISGLANKFLGFAESLKAEENKLTKFYTDRGFRAQHAAQSQGILELHKQQCLAKKCLSCGVGQYLLK
ncbi:MAG: DUF2851 family protein [Cytophagales bacterium]|nr:MAG: DUF2851 family protein [Cytophagales bacterium]TAF60320.1 MAG: DUF2851 family protein [Cytophagales bacterium]